MKTILIAGDYSPQSRVSDALDASNYDVVFKQVKPILDTVDYSIVNFESSIPSSSCKPIDKSGPNLKTNKNSITGLAYAGFDCVTLANNHITDYGAQSLQNVIVECQNNNIDCVGAGENLKEAQKILYKTIGDKKIAIINVCESEFTIATDIDAGAAPIDLVDNSYKLQEAKKNADYVIMIIHGGHEYFQLPNLRMQKSYRFFIDSGADAVINHHQHCYSGYEIHNGKPIFYGIGNFCFDHPLKRNSVWNYGFMVKLLLGDKIGFELIPYKQCDEQPSVELLTDKVEFFNTIEQLNNIIVNSKELEKQVAKYLNKEGEVLFSMFEPYFGNRYLYALFIRKLLPSLIGKKKFLTIGNIIRCESHRDKLLNYFSNRYFR